MAPSRLDIWTCSSSRNAEPVRAYGRIFQFQNIYGPSVRVIDGLIARLPTIGLTCEF